MQLVCEVSFVSLKFMGQLCYTCCVYHGGKLLWDCQSSLYTNLKLYCYHDRMYIIVWCLSNNQSSSAQSHMQLNHLITQSFSEILTKYVPYLTYEGQICGILSLMYTKHLSLPYYMWYPIIMGLFIMKFCCVLKGRRLMDTKYTYHNNCLIMLWTMICWIVLTVVVCTLTC